MSIIKKPEISGDFSIHPLYLQKRDLNKINIDKNKTIDSLYQVNDNDLNIETFYSIHYIKNQIESLINDEKYPNITELNYKNLNIGEALNIVLAKLKYSKNIGEVLLYHKLALAESEKRSYNLQKDAFTDPLTGLSNRRLAEHKLEELINNYSRIKTEFSVILIDIDYFKKINDKFGHDVGDIALKGIAEILNANIRNIDIISRWGGEEFLIILNSTNHTQALLRAETIRKSIEDDLIKYIQTKENFNNFCPHTKGCSIEKDCKNKKMECFPSKVTCSLGVSTIQFRDGETESKCSLVKRADTALYIAKENGRNMVYSGSGLELPKKEDSC